MGQGGLSGPRRPIENHRGQTIAFDGPVQQFILSDYAVGQQIPLGCPDAFLLLRAYSYPFASFPFIVVLTHESCMPCLTFTEHLERMIFKIILSYKNFFAAYRVILKLHRYTGKPAAQAVHNGYYLFLIGIKIR